MSGSVYVKEWHHMGLEVGNKGAGLRGRGLAEGCRGCKEAMWGQGAGE